MALRFLGTAVTDSNGNAVLSDGYTGTGAGSVDFVAECTVDESTVVSEPYTVMDCTQYDKGILNDSDTRDIYSRFGSAISFERKTEYTEFSASTSSWGGISINNLGGLCLEFELCQTDGYISDEIFAVSSDSSWLSGGKLNNIYSSSDNVIGQWIKLKIVFGTNSFVMSDFNDPTKVFNKTGLSASPNKLGISTSGNLRTIRFRNVKVYPI